MSSEPLSETRLRHQLDVQSQQINRVLSHHHVPASVTGGEVRSQVVSFDLQTQIAAGLERIRGLKSDLMSALGVRDVAVVHEDGQWRLRVARPYEPPVALLRLLAALPDLAPTTAAIGLADGGRPLLLEFAPNRVSHVLIAGDPGAGKTSLLRTVGAALALTNRQSDLQLVVLEPAGATAREDDTALRPLSYLPHLLADAATGVEDCAAMLRFLAAESDYRRRERIQTPRIVVLIDEIVALLEDEETTARQDLLQLVQSAAMAGIHLVMSTSRPGSSAIDATFRASVPTRLIGRLEDAAGARRATGVPLEQASLLYGSGDFLAVGGDEVVYFQAAYIGDYDLHLRLSELYGLSRPKLLAQPYSPRPRIEQRPAAGPANRSFSVKGGGVEIEDDEPDES